MPITMDEKDTRAALSKKVRELKNRIKRYRTLKTGKDTVFWKDLADELELSKKGYETKRDEVLLDDSMEPMRAYADARGCARALQAIENVRKRVESADTAIDRMNTEIASCNERIEAIDSKLGENRETTTGGVV